MIRTLILVATCSLAGCSHRDTPEATGAPPRPESAQQPQPESQSPQPQSSQPCMVPLKGEPMMCTQQYDPVCGCNGKTYGNACVATAQGVARHRPGRCEDPPDGGNQ